MIGYDKVSDANKYLEKNAINEELKIEGGQKNYDHLIKECYDNAKYRKKYYHGKNHIFLAGVNIFLTLVLEAIARMKQTIFNNESKNEASKGDGSNPKTKPD